MHGVVGLITTYFVPPEPTVLVKLIKPSLVFISVFITYKYLWHSIKVCALINKINVIKALTLTKCQRYFQRLDYNSNLSCVGMGIAYNIHRVIIYIPLLTELRANNASVIYSDNFSIAHTFTAASDISVSTLAVAAQDCGRNLIGVTTSTTENLEVGEVYVLRHNNNTESTIFLSVEL